MMIEVLTKKRILVMLAFIALVTSASLILSSHFAYNKQLQQQEEKIRNEAKKSASCEEFTSISGCEKCTKEEMRNLENACMKTGYKEQIRCNSGKDEFIWCDISPAIEESNFWKFQLFTLVIGITSYTVVHFRQKKLSKRLMDKINRQIAAGT